MNTNAKPEFNSEAEPSASEQFFWTDDDSARMQRARNQFDFYGLINDNPALSIRHLYGKSLETRLLVARLAMFPPDQFPTMGDEHGELITRKTLENMEVYPPIECVLEHFPTFVQIIDGLYKEILSIEDESARSQAGIHLASSIFALGILFHPSVDGNGIAFKLTALSYIQELVPDLSDRYFPLKYESVMPEGFDIYTKLPDTFRSIIPDAIEWKDNRDLQASQIAFEIRQLRKSFLKDSPSPSRQIDRFRLDLAIFKKIQEIAAIFPDESIIEKLREKCSEVWNLRSIENLSPDEVGISLDVPRNLHRESLKVISELLKSRGYEQAQVSRDILTSLPLREQTGYAIGRIFRDEESVNSLREYILAGAPQSDTKPGNNNCLLALVRAISDIEKSIGTILSNGEISSKEAIINQRVVLMSLKEEWDGLLERIIDAEDDQSYVHFLNGRDRLASKLNEEGKLRAEIAFARDFLSGSK